MSNVIPFRSKKRDLQKKLLILIDDLREVYNGLDMATDANFKVLRQYVDEVGAENVELGYLEYTTDIAVIFEGGDVNIKFVYNPQQLSLFPEDN